jgi:hypothetical protein
MYQERAKSSFGTAAEMPHYALPFAPSNRRLQLTVFGARDRAFFEATLCARLGGS